MTACPYCGNDRYVHTKATYRHTLSFKFDGEEMGELGEPTPIYFVEKNIAYCEDCGEKLGYIELDNNGNSVFSPLKKFSKN